MIRRINFGGKGIDASCTLVSIDPVHSNSNITQNNIARPNVVRRFKQTTKTLWFNWDLIELTFAVCCSTCYCLCRRYGYGCGWCKRIGCHTRTRDQADLIQCYVALVTITAHRLKHHLKDEHNQSSRCPRFFFIVIRVFNFYDGSLQLRYFNDVLMCNDDA